MKKIILTAVICLSFISCNLLNEGKGNIRLHNESSEYQIYYVYIFPTGSSNYGNDRLGDYDIIEELQSRTFSVDAGNNSLIVVDDYGYAFIATDIHIDENETFHVYFDGFGLYSSTTRGSSNNNNNNKIKDGIKLEKVDVKKLF